MKLQTGTIELEYCDLDYTEQGEGPIVLALHGHLSDKRVWSACSEIFSNNGYKFIAYTQRYYGVAAWPDNGDNFTRETHVQDLLNVVRKLDKGPVHLLTRSYGGDIGLRAAISHADSFSSMVHFEPSLADPIKSHPEFPTASLMRQEFEPVNRALSSGDECSAALRFIEVVYRLGEGNAEKALSPELLEMVKLHRRVVRPFNELPDSEEITNSMLASVRIPTLLMHGSESYRWFSLIVEVLEGLLPNSSKYVMSGVNHNGASKKPDEFCRTSLDLIRSVSS